MSLFKRFSVSVLATLLVVPVLVSCSGRSVEAYCEVMSKHKERYVSAMNEASQANNPLAGLTGAIAALGDINTMWEEAARVAPEEIQTDVEVVRDAWAQQEETAKEMQSNPLKALASSLVSGIMNSGSLTRVDSYTEQSCPDVGAMFISTNSATRSTAAGSDSPSATSLDPSDDDQTNEVESESVIDEDSLPFGAFMKVKSSNDGSTMFYDPDTSRAARIDAEEILPGDEIKDATYFYSTGSGEPYIVGVFEVRVPSSGLDPERYLWKIAKLSLEETFVVQAITEIEHGDFRFEQSALSSNGILLVDTTIGDNEVRAVRAVDVEAGKVLWEREGSFIKFGATDKAGLSASSGAVCEEYWGSQYIESVDLKSGRRQFVIGNTGDDCLSLDDYAVSWGSLVSYEPADNDGSAPKMVFDLDTGETEKASSLTVTDADFDVRLDPVQPLVLSGIGEGWQVVDRETGKIGFKMTGDRISSLSLEVKSLFNGLLYVTTTDEQLVLDAMNGQELGTWSRYPTEKVGSHTWMSDHVLEDEGWVDPVAETS